jgi:hypothetical protein
MEGQKISAPIFTQLAENHGKGNPQRKHDEQDEARRRLVNQNFSEAYNQSNPGLWRVQEMDPFRNGFHASKISLRETKKKLFPLPTGGREVRILGHEP